MRGARTKQGAMRVALTTVVAVLAVLAEPVLGETQPLIGKTVTARVDGSGNNVERNVVDGDKDTTGAKKDFYVGAIVKNKGVDVHQAQPNPWVQIDLGASATIQTIDVYGDRSSPQCNIAFIDANPQRAEANQDCELPANEPNVTRVDPEASGAIIAVGDTSCIPGAECIVGIDPADSKKTMGPGLASATVCAHLTKPTEVGFDGGGVINPEGKFSVDW